MTSMKLALLSALFMLITACATTQDADRVLYYRVQVKRGESIAQIAARFDTTWQVIARDNNLKRAEDVRIGMMLKVRPGPGGFLAGSQDMNTEKREPSGKKRGFFSRMFGGSDDENAEAPAKKGLLFDGGSASHMSWPVRGKINSPYGRRDGRMHEGIDISGATGDKVRAAAKGVVRFAGRSRGYGKTVIVSHGSYRTLYAHLNSIDVDTGDVVDRGDVVGEVGESGHATGPHLHFEVRSASNKALNPMAFLETRDTGTLFSAR